jgi:hypothetical protein
MTRLLVSACALAIFFCGAVVAATDADTNGDGVLTLDEALVAIPEITASTFIELDLNGDGALDAEEIEAAREAGLIPA